jgi:putative mRNA 3-end processing factor
MLFDPLESDPSISDLFISHAHYDHARGFEFPIQKKRSTEDTREVYEAENNRQVGNWEQVRIGRRIKVGDVEVEAHEAGHILGAVQYEIITPEGTVVYASHLNLTDTLLLRAAEIAPCDLLVIETSVPTQRPLSQQSALANIVKWTLECIRDERIPAFETDTIGNAQELVRAFNLWTKLPVIVHPRIARVNSVYERRGLGLRYTDASTEEAMRMIEKSHCVVLVPKRFDTSRYGNFRTAYVSASPIRARDTEREFFPLSDQADLNQLIQYVTEAKPKAVLTFYGSSEQFAQMVTKRLGITAKQLATEVARRKPVSVKVDEQRVSRCQAAILRGMEIADFTYDKRDLVAFGLRESFRSTEIDEALLRMTKNGTLKYSKLLDGYNRT